MESFDCVVCVKTIASIPTRLCEPSNHAICEPCFIFYKTMMKKPEDALKCPFLTKDGGYCGGRLLKVDTLVVQPTIDDTIVKCELPRVEPSLFAKQFSDRSEVVTEVVFKNDAESDLDDKWVPLQRLAIDYGEEDLCLLMVDENQTHVRAWLCEMNPAVEKKSPGTCYKMVAPFKPKVLPKMTFDFNGKIQPYVSSGPETDVDDEDDGFEIFKLKKLFLKRGPETAADVSFKLFIQFMKKASTAIPLGTPAAAEPVPVALAEEEPVPKVLAEEEQVPEALAEEEQVPEALVEEAPVPKVLAEEPVPETLAEEEKTPTALTEAQPVAGTSAKPAEPRPGVFGSYGPEKKTKPKSTVSKRSSTSNIPEMIPLGMMMMPDAHLYDEEELEKIRNRWQYTWGH